MVMSLPAELQRRTQMRCVCVRAFVCMCVLCVCVLCVHVCTLSNGMT